MIPCVGFVSKVRVSEASEHGSGEMSVCGKTRVKGTVKERRRRKKEEGRIIKEEWGRAKE